MNPVESGGDLGLTGSSIGEAGGKRHAPSSITKGAGIGTRVHDDSAAETVGNETPEVRTLLCLHLHVPYSQKYWQGIKFGGFVFYLCNR